MFQHLNLSRFRIGFADILFVFLTLTIMQHATLGMMDDPGLGWHLCIPDLMVEQGGFVYEEYFSFPTEGNRWITRAWLSDIIMRCAYGWGGLTALALLTSMVIAFVMRCVYRRLTGDGIHWCAATLTTIFAVAAIAPAFVARPNIISFLGLWLVADLCQRFHTGKISHKQLFWLVPIMLLWTNMHGGFMAGIVLLAIAWAVEAGQAVLSWNRNVRIAARQRVVWLSVAGFISGIATLVNPNGLALHLYNFQAVTDSFIQNNTTTEWRPPNFSASGWLGMELLIIAFPLLAATCRRRVNLMGLVMSVVWLHFALTSRRYSPLWVVIALPTLCELVVHNLWLQKLVKRLRKFASDDIRELMTPQGAGPASGMVSLVAASVLLICSAWFPQMACHDSRRLPVASLDRFLDLHTEGNTFHSVNWGGYLTWKGWGRKRRFRTWIDDRIEVHGKQHTLDYFDILQAEPDWQNKLSRDEIEWVCIPGNARLARELDTDETWRLCFSDDDVSVYHHGNLLAEQALAEVSSTSN